MPLILPTVLASFLLVFMRVFSNFATPMLIGEGYRTVPVLIVNHSLANWAGTPVLLQRSVSVSLFLQLPSFCCKIYIDKNRL